LAGIDSIEEFDERFRGTQSLFNWIQDLEDELWNAGLADRQFLTARIAVCEEGLRRSTRALTMRPPRLPVAPATTMVPEKSVGLSLADQMGRFRGDPWGSLNDLRGPNRSEIPLSREAEKRFVQIARRGLERRHGCPSCARLKPD
jgi:hypothetical protein